MPKHVLSFKHLVGAVSQQRGEQRETPERSVNDLLATSRHAVPGGAGRAMPPHMSAAAWAPGNTGPESVGVHPAELLRRDRAAHVQAARRVAGPAPPRSWRVDKARAPPVPEVDEYPVSRDAMAAAAEFLSCARPVGGLVGVCVRLILRLLHDRTVVSEQGEEVVTLGEAVLAGVGQLDTHLRAALLDTSASMDAGDSGRLTDWHVRSLLEYDPHYRRNEVAALPEDEEDWDTDRSEPLGHLALTAHANPLPLLRDAPRMRGLALTSLDLSFSTVDMNRLVAVLPPSLRLLGLAGVRAKSSAAGGWERALAVLARRMIVLQTLDISYISVGARIAIMILVGSGEAELLPSLRRLGARGTPPDEERAVRALANPRGRRRIEVVF